MSEDYVPLKRPALGLNDGLPYDHSVDQVRLPRSRETKTEIIPARPNVSANVPASKVEKAPSPIGSGSELPIADEFADREARKRRRLAILAKYQGENKAQDPPQNSSGDFQRAGPSQPKAVYANSTIVHQNGFELQKPTGATDQLASSVSAADYDSNVDQEQDNAHRFQHLMTEKSKLPVTENGAAIRSNIKEGIVTHENEDGSDDDSDFDIFAPAKMESDPTESETKEVKIDLNVPIIRRTALQNIDDSDGYYLVIPGELLDDRYHVFATLGRGMFSTVVKAWDTSTARGDTKGKEVAVKIVRSNEIMYKAGLKEIEILNLLQSQDPTDKKHLIRLERYFEYKGHLCMVFESLAMNLREVIKRFGKDVGLSLEAVRVYTKQVLLALAHLRKCGIIHADLKPDNILVNEGKNILKICDLGSASDGKGQEITPYLVSRFYRAPEVIMGMPCDSGIDTWSIGCTIFELYTGKILFAGRSNNQMLRSIQDCRGKLPHRMIKKSPFGHIHYDEKLEFVSVDIDKTTGANTSREIRYGPLADTDKDLRSKITPSPSVFKTMKSDDRKALNDFVDLLEKLLMLAPEKRILPKDALLHPFLRTV